MLTLVRNSSVPVGLPPPTRSNQNRSQTSDAGHDRAKVGSQADDSALLHGTNFQGGDIVGVRRVPSATACRTECAARASCVGFTYIIPAPLASRNCWLKRAGYVTQLSAGTISGVVPRRAQRDAQAEPPHLEWTASEPEDEWTRPPARGAISPDDGSSHVGRLVTHVHRLERELEQIEEGGRSGKVCTFVINLNRSASRLDAFRRAFVGNFTRIAAADAYDATLKDYFHGNPCLVPNGHGGTKALTLSNLYAFRAALADKTCSHAVVFEDDARPPSGMHLQLLRLFRHHQWPDVLYLDQRGGESSEEADFRDVRPGCCTTAVGYSRRAMARFERLFDWPRSELMQNYKRLNKRVVQHEHCLYDWMLANFAAHDAMRASRLRRSPWSGPAKGLRRSMLDIDFFAHDPLTPTLPRPNENIKTALSKRNGTEPAFSKFFPGFSSGGLPC